jgi:hypothetical protein
LAKHQPITRQGKTTLAKGDTSGIPQHLVEKAYELSKSEGIPVQGLTVLGGKFYVNTTGLDTKIKNLEDNGVVLSASKAVEIQRATKENWEAGFKGVIELFDREGFSGAVKGVTDAEAIKALKEAFTRVHEDEGWASKENVSLPAIKNSPGYLNMMASRRATNRAKRLATGCGLTSVEEMDMSNLSPDEAREVEAEIIGSAKDANTVDAPAVVMSDSISALMEKLKEKGIGGGKIKVLEAKIRDLPEEVMIKQLEEELARA